MASPRFLFYAIVSVCREQVWAGASTSSKGGFFLHDEALAVFGKGGAEGVDEELHDGFTCLTKKVNNPVDYPRLMRKTSVGGVRLDVIGKAKFICSVSIYAPTVWAFSPLFIGTLIVSSL